MLKIYKVTNGFVASHGNQSASLLLCILLGKVLVEKSDVIPIPEESEHLSLDLNTWIWTPRMR